MSEKDIYTQRVIYWIDNHNYSKEHWATVAQECLDQAKGDEEEAILILADALKSFHYKFQEAVVKPGNVLHEFISMCLGDVDWTIVARSRYMNFELPPVS